MKKVLYAILCLILILSSLPVLGVEMSSSSAHYPNSVRQLLTDYENGEYGDEVYQLIFSESFVMNSFSATVGVKDGEATLYFVNIYGDRYERKLSQEEFQKLTSFVSDNGVDDLEGWISYNVADGTSYGYTHIYGDNVSYVGMTNPEYGGEEGAVYAELVMMFKLLINPAIRPDVVLSEEITVNVNGSNVDFPLFTDNGHTHIGKEFVESIGAKCSMTSDSLEIYYFYLFRGGKLIMMPVGRRYMVFVDATGFDSLEALEADVGDGDIREKDYCKVVPLDTVIVNGYIPLRAVCEILGGGVDWNGEENLINVNIEENNTPNNSYIYASYVTRMIKLEQSLVIM